MLQFFSSFCCSSEGGVWLVVGVGFGVAWGAPGLPVLFLRASSSAFLRAAASRSAVSRVSLERQAVACLPSSVTLSTAWLRLSTAMVSLTWLRW